jgi:ribosomal protein S18 acetylase RimI-like enzyme
VSVGYTIRQMELSDINSLNQVTYSSFPKFFNYIATHSQYKKGQVLIGDAQGTAVGFIKLVEFHMEDEKFGFIVGLAVHRHFRRKGIAKSLVNAGIQLLKQDGVQVVFATAHMGNRASLGVFDTQGFKKMSFLSLRRIFGWSIFRFYNNVWYTLGEIILMHK